MVFRLIVILVLFVSCQKEFDTETVSVDLGKWNCNQYPDWNIRFDVSDKNIMSYSCEIYSDSGEIFDLNIGGKLKICQTCNKIHFHLDYQGVFDNKNFSSQDINRGRIIVSYGKIR